MAVNREATIDDLYHVEATGGIVDEELVLRSLSSDLHGFASLVIGVSLLGYARRTKRGHAFGDSVSFIVNLPHQRSFGPDAAFCTQLVTKKFVDGAPVLAVGVRSEEDSGLVVECTAPE